MQPPVVADTVVADTVVPAVTRRQKEGYTGGKVARVVLLCASALVGIFFTIGSVALYEVNRDLAMHGVRTQGQVVEADAVGSDKVVYTVGGTVYAVPVGGTVYEVSGAEVGDRLPGDAATVIYDPRDPSISNLENDSVGWHSHWIFLGLGLFFLAIPAIPVVAGVFEADGPVGRRLARARPARHRPGTPPTPPGPSDREPPPAGQAPPEPYVPGSGDRLPAELRRVLAGSVGLACGLFAGALACAAALILFVFVADDLDHYNGLYDLLYGLVLMAFSWGALWGLGLGLRRALTYSRRAAGIPGCSGSPAIHARPR